MKNQIVNDTVTELFNQTDLDEKFRADFTKRIAAVWDAGAASTQTVVKSEPLSAEEIELVRASLRAK